MGMRACNHSLLPAELFQLRATFQCLLLVTFSCVLFEAVHCILTKMHYEAILISLMTLADIKYAYQPPYPPSYCLLKGFEF